LDHAKELVIAGEREPRDVSPGWRISSAAPDAPTTRTDAAGEIGKGEAVGYPGPSRDAEAAPCNCQGCVLLLGRGRFTCARVLAVPAGPATSARRRTVRMVADYQPSATSRSHRRAGTALRKGEPDVVLLGATGTGKSATTPGWWRSSSGRRWWIAPKQDAGGASWPNELKGFFPDNASILRQLLRLLPARGVHPADRHLHRERTPRSTRTWSGCPCRDE